MSEEEFDAELKILKDWSRFKRKQRISDKNNISKAMKAKEVALEVCFVKYYILFIAEFCENSKLVVI